MHWFKFHISDYLAATAHLSHIEDLAYRRMLELAYDTEKPLPADVSAIARRIRMRGEEESISVVLDEFWQQADDGWHHDRVDAELQAASRAAEVARENGSKGGRPRKPRPTEPDPTKNPPETQGVSDGNPGASQQKATQDSKTPRRQDSLERTNERDAAAPSQNGAPTPSSTSTGPPPDSPDRVAPMVAGTIRRLADARRAQ